MSNFLFNTVEYIHDVATGVNITDTGTYLLIILNNKQASRVGLGCYIKKVETSVTSVSSAFNFSIFSQFGILRHRY